MAICLERGADLHMAQLMPLPLTVSCFSKIHIGFTFLVPAHPGSLRQRAIKRVCVCVIYYKLLVYSFLSQKVDDRSKPKSNQLFVVQRSTYNWNAMRTDLQFPVNKSTAAAINCGAPPSWQIATATEKVMYPQQRLADWQFPLSVKLYQTSPALVTCHIITTIIISCSSRWNYCFAEWFHCFSFQSVNCWQA